MNGKHNNGRNVQRNTTIHHRVAVLEDTQIDSSAQMERMNVTMEKIEKLMEENLSNIIDLRMLRQSFEDHRSSNEDAFVTMNQNLMVLNQKSDSYLKWTISVIGIIVTTITIIIGYLNNQIALNNEKIIGNINGLTQLEGRVNECKSRFEDHAKQK